MVKMLNNMNPTSQSSITNLKLDLAACQNILTENTVIINKAFQNQLIIPKFQDFCDSISKIYEKVRIFIEWGNDLYIYI